MGIVEMAIMVRSLERQATLLYRDPSRIGTEENIKIEQERERIQKEIDNLLHNAQSKEHEPSSSVTALQIVNMA
jgi:hypothetical protein